MSPLTWLSPLRQRAGEKILFAFPPAGGGPSLFRAWLPYLPPSVSLVALRAPGREDRLNEPPLRDLGTLADAAAAALRAYADRPFAIFGHSMGGLLGAEVAARLVGEPLELLVVAGCRPPHQPVDSLAEASDAEIRQALTAWGGTPEAVLADPDLFEIFLPCLRADFAVCDAARRPLSRAGVLDVPVLAMTGTGDPLASPADCVEWSRWTRAAFEQVVIAGNHFFPFASPAAVLDPIEAWLTAMPEARSVRHG